ncbi:response regulator transcription factor [Clostridium saccharobutylicum]|uniref:Stage 0 sporulation protein A homolog n=1 Tax=Clostridium saccharobutylicum TaxID=169679 RepID=A0A1S8N5Q3_CLOSA|nr:response regulator [Clostridium saccharobutylicum]OOM11760.1 putative response regulatory protein [Clostridium saccharobutylicum]
MWKLIIADDEPKIRRGIRNMINWESYDIEIVGEAEDGEIALEVISEKKPDIVLLDINMPFINGLNLLKKLKNLNTKSLVIIISGYDDFSYVQRALQFNVFDYILKPVNKKNMSEIILKAICRLEEIKREENYKIWVKKQLTNNIDKLRKTFFSEWLDNKLTDDEALAEMNFFNIKFEDNIGIIIIKLIDKMNFEIVNKDWNEDLLEFAISNLLNEEFKDFKNKLIFTDDKKNIILVANINETVNWINTEKRIQVDISKYLKCSVIVKQKEIYGDILKVKNAYTDLINTINEEKKYNPIVLFAIKYIEENYYLNNLSVNEISNKLEVTSSYLSKLIKKETGLSFIDYLTNVRIKQAMCIMRDPVVKIYDVAELVGYSNQHYFCRAFKKIVGVSPTEYKRGR